MKQRSNAGAERWGVLAAGVIIMMTAGTAYSWSLFSRPFMAFYGWTSLQTSMAFGLLIFFVGMGALLGGNLHDRFGAHRVTMLGVALWGIGNLLCGLGVAKFGLPWLYFTYGALAGTGCGIIYVSPGACVTRWFPEMRGLANGLILLGFGMGSFVFNAIVAADPAFSRAANVANTIIAHRNADVASGVNVTPLVVSSMNRQAVSDVFIIAGIAFLIIGFACAYVLHEAPAGYAGAKANAKAAERDYTPREMIRTPAFYFVWGFFFIDAIAALALLGNAVPIYSELTGAGATTATVVYGTLSIFNGLGRLVWAWISDFIGRLPAVAACLLIAGVSMGALVRLHDPVAVSVVFGLFIFTFSGVFGVVPPVMADFFGMKYFGENYSFIVTAAAVAGVAGPLIVGVLEDATGSLTSAITPLAVILVLAAALPLLARKPTAAPAPVATSV